ncbi:MAG: PAS domain S-box protein, partial [Telluria sp.]
SHSQQRFARLLESSSEGIFGVSADFVCTFINPAGARMLGYEPAELIGQQLQKVSRGPSADAVQDCTLAAAARASAPIRIEDDVFWHKSGRAVEVAYGLSPLAGAGPAEGAVVTFTVISGRKAIERALYESQERLRLATDASNLGLWAWDPVADQLRWENERPHQMFALASTDPLVDAAAFIDACIHPAFVALMKGALTRAVEHGAAFQFEARLRNCVGEVEWVEFSGRLKQHADGHAEVLGTVADITQRKRADVALHESRESLEKIITQAATGVVQADMDGKLTLVNKKFCDMLGYDEVGLLGCSILSLTAPSFVEPTRASMHKLAAGGVPFVLEKQYVRKDGSTLWATSSVSALRSPEGKFQGMVAIVVDVTERREAVDKLRDADRRKDEFLAMLAHELRNPLAPIASAAEILALPALDATRVKRTGEVIRRQVKHMTALVDDLLDVSRVTRGLVELDKQPEDIAHVLALAVEQVTPLLDSRRHRLVTRMAPGKVLVLGDDSRLVQVFANLLNNAAKYTPDGGEIELAAQVEGGTIFVTVTDNGAGIEQDLMGRIFDLFSQAHRTSDRTSGGLGIGLALVKSLVELHGGRISCASAGPRLGSQFTVSLPLLDLRTARALAPRSALV